MIRNGRDDAIVRATVRDDQSEVLIEAQLSRNGRSRIQVNRQPARTRRDLADAVAVTTFAPEDVGIVRGGPSGRRDVLDDALSLLDPAPARSSRTSLACCASAARCSANCTAGSTRPAPPRSTSGTSGSPSSATTSPGAAAHCASHP